MSDQRDDREAPRGPSHIAYQVRETDEGKSYFNRVGSAFEHRDGQGFNIVMDSVPVDGRLTLRTPQQRLEQRDKGGERQSQSRDARPVRNRFDEQTRRFRQSDLEALKAARPKPEVQRVFAPDGQDWQVLTNELNEKREAQIKALEMRSEALRAKLFCDFHRAAPGDAGDLRSSVSPDRSR